MTGDELVFADGGEFSTYFFSMSERSKVIFALALVRCLPAAGKRLKPDVAKVTRYLDDWLRGVNPGAAGEVVGVCDSLEEATAVPGTTAAEMLLVTSVVFAFQRAAWSAVAAGDLDEKALHSGYYEGDWWFRKAVWEASTDRRNLARLCRRAARASTKLRGRMDSPFAKGIGALGTNDGDIPKWVRMEREAAEVAKEKTRTKTKAKRKAK